MFGRIREEPPPQARVGATTRPVGGPPALNTGPPEGLILLIFALLTIAASAFVLARAEHDAVHDPSEKAARGEIKGLDKLSLLRAENLRRVLDDTAKSSRPLVTNIRVAADRVNLTVRDPDGSRKIRTVDPSFDVDENDFGVGEDDAIEASKLDPRAPERMVRAVAERTGLGVDAVDYVTLSASGTGPPTWYMSLDQGPARVRQWIAEADGSDLRRPGEMSQRQKEADARRRRQFERQQKRRERVFAQRTKCLQGAGSAEAAARCLERFPP